MSPYEILKISPDATGDEIKRAYRTLAKRFHPDKNPNNKQAEEYFKKIVEAYEILSNEKRREEFDKTTTSYTHQSHTYKSQSNRADTKREENNSTKQKAGESQFNYGAFDEKGAHTEQSMREREQKIKSDEDSLRVRLKRFKNLKRRFWITSAIVNFVVGVTLFLIMNNKNGSCERLMIKNDSLNYELQSREFLLNLDLEKSQLQTIKSLMLVYNTKGIHSYITFEAFLEAIRDKQKARDIYAKFVKVNRSVSMNFDQFYKLVKRINHVEY